MMQADTTANETDNAEHRSDRSPRIHGGDIAAAVKSYGIEERDLIDFSSNVNPLGPSRSAVRAVKKSLSRIDRYPDPTATELRQAIARYHGIKPEQVVCGNGSNALIHLIPRLLRPKRAVIPIPTFTEYAAAVEAAGGLVVPLSLSEDDGFRVDPIELSFAVKGMDMAFLCNPNNPTGRLMNRAEIVEIMHSTAREGATLVVDEAFMDFDDRQAVIKEALEFPQVICLRAFTKFFGMPGLRVGYAVSNEDVAAALRNAQEPWTVSIPAERAAIAALGDWSHMKKTRALIQRERERLLSELRLLPGVDPFPAAANFLFIRLSSIDAPTLTRKLGLRGILIRDCSSFPGLNNRFVRIAVRGPRENKRLLQALREILIA